MTSNFHLQTLNQSMAQSSIGGSSIPSCSIDGYPNLYSDGVSVDRERLKQAINSEKQTRLDTVADKHESGVTASSSAASIVDQLQALARRKSYYNVIHDLGADRGGERGTVQLAGTQINPVFPFCEVLKVIKRECQDFGSSTPHLAGMKICPYVSSNGKGWEADELEREINLLLNRCAARGIEGDIAYAHFAEWEVDELARWIKLTLNQGAARGVEGGIAHLTWSEVVELVVRINVQLSRGTARGNEGGTAHLGGMQINSLVSSFNERYEVFTRERQVYDWGLSAARGHGVGTSHSGMQINQYISSLCVGWELDEFASQNHVLPNRGAARGNERPDSMPLNNMPTSPANNPLGFAPRTSKPRNRASSPRRTQAEESHNMDIKDEEPQSTDSVIQERINMKLNQSAARGAEGDTPHLVGMQTNPLVSPFNKGLEEVELASRDNANRGNAGGNELPGTSRPRNRESSLRRTQSARSSKIDINGEPKNSDSVIQEPDKKFSEKNSDSVIQEPDKKFSEWSNALTIFRAVSKF